MKKIVFTIVFALLICSLQAKPVDVQTAKSLGVKFMKANTEMKSATAELTFTAFADNGQAAFYVFAVQPKGFVIVSADDRAKPILGYSTESNFTPQLPDGLMTFFENYKAGFSQMFANNDERTAEAVADWTSMEATGRPAAKRTRNVAPLLASIWNQTDLYNNMAPEDPSSVYSGHCKAGCVANAMSQIMRYWEWPRHGQGEHGYVANTQYGNYGWQEANFENATYRFELMPDFLDFASPQSEVDATALLERHAGVSVDMMYGPNASGAYSQDVGPAYQEYFRYSSDLQHRYQDDSYDWEEDLMENLDAGMPLYYASQGNNGGHAYVLDGYDDFYMFHLNWGWAGFDNGWYAIDGFYLTFYSFPWYHNAIFNLHPVDEYYDAPEAVTDLHLGESPDLLVDVFFTPVFQTRGGEPLNAIDTIVLMRDGVRVDELVNVTNTATWFRDQVEKAGTYYYTVYAVNEAGMSKVMRDTITVGNTCNLRFELADTGGDGWDMSFIAVLDEDGKVSQRVGLWDGGSASITVPAPDDQTATFFWTYDNTCYSHGSLSEVSYEIYDWNDNLIVASNGYPEVGEIVDYDINCGMDCHPAEITWSAYQWSPEGYSATFSWEWTGVGFAKYNIYRDDELIASIDNPYEMQYVDENPETGDLTYAVSVVYDYDGETCESEKATVEIEVTSVEEHQAHAVLYPNPASHSFTVEGTVKEVKVFDALGQLMHQSSENTVEVNTWPQGVYFVCITDDHDAVMTMKFVKQ